MPPPNKDPNPPTIPNPPLRVVNKTGIKADASIPSSSRNHLGSVSSYCRRDSHTTDPWQPCDPILSGSVSQCVRALQTLIRGKGFICPPFIYLFLFNPQQLGRSCHYKKVRPIRLRGNIGHQGWKS